MARAPLPRMPARGAEVESSIPSSVSLNVPKCMAMLTRAPTSRCDRHGLVRVHVDRLHEPARLVRADRDERDVDLAAGATGSPGRADRIRCRLRSRSVFCRAVTAKPLHSVRLRSPMPRAEKCCAGVHDDLGADACVASHQSSSTTLRSPMRWRSRRLPSVVTKSGWKRSSASRSDAG